MLENFLQAIADFLETLPPLLQLMAGVFVILGLVKIFMMIVNYFESKSEKKK